MHILNAQQRAWILPANPANETHVAVTINPGASAEVDNEHWAAVRKGNEVIEFLVVNRYIIPSTEPSNVVPQLRNTPTADRPPELDDVDGVDAKKKTEVLDVPDDEPATPRRGRRST